MIKLRTASALAAGAVAALAIGGTALAAGADDTGRSTGGSPAVSMRPDGTVVTTTEPAPPAPTDDSTDDSSVDPSPSSSASSAPTTAPAPRSSSSAAASADAISLGAAKRIAIRAAGGGRVTGVERETEHGRAVWDVEVRVGDREHDLDVDRATGEVLRHRSERDTDDRGHDDRDDHGHGHDDDRYDD